MPLSDQDGMMKCNMCSTHYEIDRWDSCPECHPSRMRLTDKDVLITGGCGFIGSNLANRLVQDNDVTVIDNEYLGNPDNLDSDVTYRNKDVRTVEISGSFDVVFHLAALSSYPMHEEAPVEGADVNIAGFVNVVDQAKEQDCDHIVYASTASLYGTCENPVQEQDVASAESGYAASKMARESYADYFSYHYDMTMCGVRYFSVYAGYHQNERHKGEYANVVTQFADNVANGENPIIYGDGTQFRDYIHVDDVVNATISVAERRLSGKYNIGTERVFSYNEVVDMINEELGTNVEPEYIDNPIPEHVYVHGTYANISKMLDETNWKPCIPFEEGLEMVCEGYKQECTKP